jgi:hypothetical protein
MGIYKATNIESVGIQCGNWGCGERVQCWGEGLEAKELYRIQRVRRGSLGLKGVINSCESVEGSRDGEEKRKERY